MSDSANIVANLVKVKIAGTTFHTQQVDVTLGGVNIDVFSAEAGQFVAGIQGGQNLDLKISVVEDTPAVMRALSGLGSSGVVTHPAPGTAGPYVEIQLVHPADVSEAGRVTFPKCRLVSQQRNQDGKAESKPVYTFRAYPDGSNRCWTVGVA